MMANYDMHRSLMLKLSDPSLLLTEYLFLDVFQTAIPLPLGDEDSGKAHPKPNTPKPIFATVVATAPNTGIEAIAVAVGSIAAAAVAEVAAMVVAPATQAAVEIADNTTGAANIIADTTNTTAKAAITG